ncbi:MAG: diphthine--ammonia ligase [Candidatus Omnitrophica bacterium]|nr:diphthine--ammonia ligase [Candidatus Omnitrophota bacterium]
MKSNVIASWSGGKDSCLALYRAMKQGYKINNLLNFISKGSGRGCFHGLTADLLKYQAKLMGFPLTQCAVSPDMKLYEEEFKQAVDRFIKKGARYMVFGDIYLLEHSSWVERVCGELGINPVEPLWADDTLGLIDEFVDAGFKAVIVSCKADVMGEEYLGRIIDKPLAKELKAKGICPCGENGEYHTLVVDGPIFAKPIQILDSEKIKKQGFWEHWFLDIKYYQ